MTAAHALAVLIALHPSLARMRDAILPRLVTIERACDAARFRRCALAYAVAFVESGYVHTPLAGCKPYSGAHGEDTAQARCAVVSIAHAMRACPTLPDALMRYNTGACRPRTRRVRVRATHYARNVLAIVRAMESH